MQLHLESDVWRRLIDEKRHHILKAAHPSGLSANRGFFGCRLVLSFNSIRFFNIRKRNLGFSLTFVLYHFPSI